MLCVARVYDTAAIGGFSGGAPAYYCQILAYIWGGGGGGLEVINTFSFLFTIPGSAIYMCTPTYPSHLRRAIVFVGKNDIERKQAESIDS